LRASSSPAHFAWLRRAKRFARLACLLCWGAGIWTRPSAAFAGEIGSAEDARTEPEQVVRLDVRGAVAEVTVTRTLRHCDGLPWAQARARGECVLDIVLPNGAALLSVQIRDGRVIPPIAPTLIMPANAGLERYRQALRAAHVEPSAIPFDDDARYRVRVLDTTNDRQRAAILQYSFVAPVEVAGNLAYVSFPPSPELSPPEARVEVFARTEWPVTAIAIAGQNAALGAAGGSLRASATGAASTRTTWRVDLTLGAPPRGADPGGRVVALASRSGAAPGKLRLAVAIGVRSSGAGAEPLPDRVLFVIDASRSVGPGGLEAERELAQQLLRRLPPSTRFDAVFFDRRTRRLFPVARTATRQAIAALADEMVTDHLANGTELAPAIEFATGLLRREAADFGPRALLVVLTDGAVGGAVSGNEPWPASTWPSAFKPPLPGLDIAVLSIRPNDDPAVSPEDRAHLRALASQASLAGLEATMTVGELSEGLDTALAGLRAGGSVFAVGVAAGDSRPRALASDIAPGQGFATLIELASASIERSPSTRAGAPLALEFQYRGARMSLPVRATSVPEKLLSALFEVPSARTEPVPREAIRGWITPHLAALWEPVVRPAARSRPDDSQTSSPRGFMERSVVRDALSLAFTPRARGCYLSRSARTPADRELAGRVRIAIDMHRGEVVATHILSSTLAHPAIEITAVLNLVFRPRTTEYHRPSDRERSEFDRELELVIERAAEPLARDGGAEPDADASSQ
jgi:von Willebrand factor type A domain